MFHRLRPATRGVDVPEGVRDSLRGAAGDGDHPSVRSERHDGGARQLVDFMLGKQFQEDLPLNMFVFPARADADLPPEFVAHTEIPPTPASLPPDVIDSNRERWIEEWTEIMRS